MHVCTVCQGLGPFADLVKLQPAAQSHDIGQCTFVSRHFVAIIINFDKACDMQCWPSFSDTYFDLEIQWM